MIIFYVAKAGVEFNPGFAGYAAVWLTGALAYYVWNESGGRLNRLLMCGGLIAFIVLVEGWRAQRLGTAPWIVARDVLVAAGIAWLLFKLRVAMPAGKRLADCSYSLYATHFPVLLLAQSLLISTNSTSVTAAVGVAVISTVVSIGVALIGGAIEAKKAAAQSRILALTMHLKKRYST